MFPVTIGFINILHLILKLPQCKYSTHFQSRRRFFILILSRLPIRMWAACFVSSQMNCRPLRMQGREFGFLDTFFQVRHPSFVELSWDIWHTCTTTGWDGTNALPNGPNLFYQIINRYSPHVIANVFMGHIHDEVRYIYYACVKCRVISWYFDVYLLNLEIMVLLWTTPPH